MSDLDLITVDPARLSTVAMATLHVERGTSERLQSSGRLCTVPYLAHGLKHLSPAAVKPCAYQCTVPWPGSLPDYCCTYVRVRAYARAAPDSFPNLREILVDSFHILHSNFTFHIFNFMFYIFHSSPWSSPLLRPGSESRLQAVQIVH